MDYLQLMDIPGSSSNLFFVVVAVQEKTFVQNRSGEKRKNHDFYSYFAFPFVR
jgi:hypothetical protein